MEEYNKEGGAGIQEGFAMKIGFTVNRYVKGSGIAEYLLGLNKYLGKKHDVYIISPVSDVKTKNVLRTDWALNIPVVKHFLPYRISHLPKLDIIVSNYPPISAIKTAIKIGKMEKIPHVLIDYGVAEPKHFEKRAYLSHAIGRSEMKRYYTKADKILSISRYLRSEVRDMGLESSVILGGIDYKKFQKRKSTGILKKNKLSKNKYALFVGRISPHKGIHLVAEAMEKAGWPVKFVVVGGHGIGVYPKRLKRKYKEKITFAGRVTDQELVDLYQNSMFYITGSLWEGLNLTLLEAQACGKPVIAFDLCAHPEVVDQGGVLISPGNIHEMALAIKSFSKRPALRRKMGFEARKWAKRFDWSVIGKKIEEEIVKVRK
jgi:1,2-diacylglycerol 3-alpha-glucosyltransferase